MDGRLPALVIEPTPTVTAAAFDPNSTNQSEKSPLCDASTHLKIWRSPVTASLYIPMA